MQSSALPNEVASPVDETPEQQTERRRFGGAGTVAGHEAGEDRPGQRGRSLRPSRATAGRAGRAAGGYRRWLRTALQASLAVGVATWCALALAGSGIAFGDDEETPAPVPAPTPVPSLPDLAPVSLTAPPSARAGDRVAVSWSVMNRGGGPVTTAYFDGLFLTPNGVFDGGTAPAGNYNVQVAVASGATYQESEVFAVPLVPPGNYHLLLHVDVFNHVAESDESNNWLAVPFAVVR